MIDKRLYYSIEEFVEFDNVYRLGCTRKIWLRRKLIGSYTFGFICVLLICLLGLLLALRYSQHRQQICTSQACIKAANLILGNIDTSVDPCDNFYEFTCGNFVRSQRIPDNQAKIDVFDNLRDKLSYNVANLLSESVKDNEIEAVKKVKYFYQSCMDEDSTENNGEKVLIDYVDKEFGGWPILKNKSFVNEMKDTLKITRLRYLGVKPLLDVSVSSDPKKPEKAVLRLKQPGWIVNKEIYDNEKIVRAYKTYMRLFFTYLGSESEDLDGEVDRIFELERKIAQSQIDGSLIRTATYKNLTITGLALEFPDFPWREFILEGLYGDSSRFNFSLSMNETILVDQWDYIARAVDIHKDYLTNRPRDLVNFYIWKFVKEKTSYLPKKYKLAKLEFEKTTKGTSELHSASFLCSNIVMDSMEYAVGRIYVDKYFNGNSKDSAVHMIQNIISEFKLILGEIDWMDGESKAKAYDKANAIDIKIGYPDFIKNDTYLNSLYDIFNVTSTNGFFQNHIEIKRTSSISYFKSLRSSKNTKTWFIGPAVINAFYSPSFNQICFPAGILQAPFYEASAPKYLNYGGIGSVIGHEITHGFDDRGRLFDKDGVFFPDTESLWTNKTISNYKENVQCIIDQYSSYTSLQVNRSLNGIQSQGENIADNGGVKESFRAYQKWVKANGEEAKLPGLDYTPNQLFFINYGQVWCSKFRDEYLVTRILNGHHSPGEFRVIGPTSNSEDFAKTFQCKPNQKNNPANKCSVW